jgi:hypothetical protein
MAFSRTETLIWEAEGTFWGKAITHIMVGGFCVAENLNSLLAVCSFKWGVFKVRADIQIITFSGLAWRRGESWPAIAKFSALFCNFLMFFLFWKTF